MAIIYSYPEIPDVQGGDLLLISDTGAPNKPTRSVDIDDLAAYIGTVIGIGFWNLGTAPDSIFTTKMASIGQDANIGNSKLNVYKTDDMTASVPHIATFNESSSNHSANLWPSPGDNAADIYGGVSRATFTGAGTVDQIIGSNPIGRHSGSGSVNFIQGSQATASLTGSGTAEVIAASYAKAFIEGTGSNNIENAIGAWNAVGLNGLNDVDTIYGTYSNVVLTNGEVNDDAIGHYIEFEQVAAGTEINNAYYIHAKNNSLSVTGEKFFIKDETGIPSQFSNKLVLNAYGSGTFTGTATQRLAVDTNGNVIEIPIGSGPVDGSGTANYTARWIDTDTLGIGALYDNGTNIGIGTTNPTKKLHVNGEAFFQNTVSLPDNAYVGLGSSFDFHLSHNGSSSSITNSTGNLNISSNGGDAVFNTASTERLRITSSGNVGIGTTSPGSTLPADSETATKALQLTGVSGSAGDTAVLLRSSDNSSGLDLWHNASTGDSYIDNRYSSNQGDTIFRIKTAGTPLEALRITGDGNVGIGTTSPSEKLEVVGTIKSNQVDAFAENIPSRIGRSTGQHLSLYGNSTGNYLIGVGNKNTIIGRSGQGRIVFRNDGIQFSTEATQTRSDLFIEVINGYVGVGTSSPSQKLEVAGNILVRGSNDSADGLHLKDRTFVAFSDASSVVSRFRSSAAGIFQFQDGSYNTNIVLHTNGNSYLNGGNVGIGTTTPGAKLSVNGNVKIEGTNSLLFGGSATVPIWAISSNGSDLLIDDQASNIGSVLFNNNEGVALPRLTTTQINAISSPAQGLMAYNTTLNTICFYNGSSWQKVNHANM